MESTIDETQTKELLKEVVLELITERRGEFYEIIVEAMEEIGLAQAIREGRRDEFVSEEQINTHKDIPTFESKDEEREFWATHDSTEYVDWDKASPAYFPKLKPSTKSISLRLPEMMLNKLRLIANKRDVPYQSLIKVFLQDRINQELTRLDSSEDTAPLEGVEADKPSPVEVGSLA